MNQKHRILKGRFILLLKIFMLFVSFVVSAASKDSIYQISTYDSLSKGGYAGIVPLKDLTKNGDFGIGTLEGINGEMVMILFPRVLYFFSLCVNPDFFPILDHNGLSIFIK